MRVAQHPVRPTHLIINHPGLFFKQGAPRILLVLDNLQNDFVEPVDYIPFPLAQRGLIGDLKKITERFRSGAPDRLGGL